jgi:hypothetical protein
VVRLLLAREEDRMVDIAERMDPAIRGRWDGENTFVDDRYVRNPLPSASS